METKEVEMDFGSLAGHNVFITGGSRGIGAATVQLLSALGARVAFSYSSQEAKAHELLKSLTGKGHFCLQMNVADEASITAGFNQLSGQFTQLHGLVCNAGITRDQLALRL